MHQSHVERLDVLVKAVKIKGIAERVLSTTVLIFAIECNSKLAFSVFSRSLME